MAVSVRCPNQHKLSVPEKLLGKKLRCPKCNETVLVAKPGASESQVPNKSRRPRKTPPSHVIDDDELGASKPEPAALPPRRGAAKAKRKKRDKSAQRQEKVLADEQNSERKKKLLLVGSIGGVCVLGVVGAVLFSGGGESETIPDETVPIVESTPVAVEVETAESPAQKEPKLAAITETSVSDTAEENLMEETVAGTDSAIPDAVASQPVAAALSVQKSSMPAPTAPATSATTSTAAPTETSEMPKHTAADDEREADLTGLLTSGLPPEQQVAVPLGKDFSNVKLLKGPRGMSVSDGRLMWKPERDDVGPHTFSLEFDADDGRSERSYSCFVSEKPIKLSFTPKGFRTFSDGRTGVAWGPKLAVVDLDTREVVIEKPSDWMLADVAVTNDHVLALRNEVVPVQGPDLGGTNDRGWTLDVFRRADLSLEKTVLLARAASKIEVFDDVVQLSVDHFGMHRNEQFAERAPRSWLRTSDFQEPELIKTLLSNAIVNHISLTRQNPGQIPVTRAGDGWLFAGALLDSEMTAVRHYVSVQGTVLCAALFRPGQLPPAGHTVEKTGRLKKLSEAYGWDIDTRQENIGGQEGCVVKVRLSTNKITYNKEHRVGWVPGIPRMRQTAFYEDGAVFVLAENRLFPIYTKDLIEPAPKAVTEPLTLVSADPVFLLSSTRPTRLKYQASGGTPPYRYQCVIQDLPSYAEKLPQLAITDRKNGAFDIDGRMFVSNWESMRLVSAQLLSGIRIGRPAANPKETLKNYRQDVQEKLHLPKPPRFKGVPISVRLTIVVSDSADQRQGLAHDLILDLPETKILTSLRPPTPAPPLSDLEQMMRLIKRIDPMQNHFVVSELNWESAPGAVEFSKAFRETFPRPDITGADVEHLAAVFNFNHSNITAGNMIPRPPSRTWTLRDGTKVEAAIEQCTHGFLSFGNGKSVGSLDLTADSIRQAMEDLKPSYSAIWPRGFSQFCTVHGCYPPAAIVDEKGKPLLSWRVALLPYIGQSSLFSLFHLDEPWDSPHNIKLLNAVPLQYRPGPAALKPGHCTLLALVGDKTVFPPIGLTRLSDFKRPGHKTLLAVEVAPSHSVEWTRPVDLNVGDDATAFDAVANNEGRGGRGGKFQVIFAQEDDKDLPSDTSREKLLEFSALGD